VLVLIELGNHGLGLMLLFSPLLFPIEECVSKQVEVINEKV